MTAGGAFRSQLKQETEHSDSNSGFLLTEITAQNCILNAEKVRNIRHKHVAHCKDFWEQPQGNVVISDMLGMGHYRKIRRLWDKDKSAEYGHGLSQNSAGAGGVRLQVANYKSPESIGCISRQLEDGDMININITVFINGHRHHGDCSETILVGEVDKTEQELVEVARTDLCVGIEQCGPDRPFGNIGVDAEALVEDQGLRVVPALTGHWIETFLHGLPDIQPCRNFYAGTMETGQQYWEDMVRRNTPTEPDPHLHHQQHHDPQQAQKHVVRLRHIIELPSLRCGIHSLEPYFTEAVTVVEQYVACSHQEANRHNMANKQCGFYKYLDRGGPDLVITHTKYMSQMFIGDWASMGVTKAVPTKVTTLLGLYLFTGLLEPVAIGMDVPRQDLCSVGHVKAVNLLMAVINAVRLHSLTNHVRGVKKIYSSEVLGIWSSFNMSLLPVLYLFSSLYYTDPVTVCMVLPAYCLCLSGQDWLAGFAGVLAVLARQTNIVWVFLAGAETAGYLVISGVRLHQARTRNLPTISLTMGW
jgi:hypothetical protein